MTLYVVPNLKPIARLLLKRNALLLVLYAWLLQPAQASDEAVWNLRLHHSYYKLCSATISQSRATISAGMFSFTLLPPDYKRLYVLNPVDKLYLETTCQDWFIPRWRNGNVFDKYVRAGQEVVCGVSCTHYLCFDKVGQQRAEFWATKAIPAKPAMADAYCIICGVPTGFGIPIRFLCSRRSLVSFIEPLAAKKSTVSGTDPFLPPGFKRAKDRGSLMFSQDGNLNKSDLEDLFRSKEGEK